MEAFMSPSPSPPASEGPGLRPELEALAAGPVAPEVASGDVVTPLDLQLRRLSRDLEDDFPSVPPTRVRALLETALDQTRGAVIQTFRPTLAERKVREALRSSGAADPGL